MQEAVKNLRAGKATGSDQCAVKYLTSGRMTVIEWLVRLLSNYQNCCM